MFVKLVKIVWTLLAVVPSFIEYERFAIQCQLINHPPHFVPGSGDMSRFSLSENTPIDSPVYQLRGNYLIFIQF